MLFLPSITSSRSQVFTLGPNEARARLSEPGHTIVEILRRGSITKIYLDYDHILPERAREAGPLTEDELALHRVPLEERLNHVQACLRSSARAATASSLVRTWTDEQEESIRYVLAYRHGWCNTKGAWKVSFRPFFLGLRIQYEQIVHILSITNQSRPHDSFWDLSVYKQSEQLLACINGIKSQADPRMLRHADLDADTDTDTLDYVAQAVDDAWPLMTISPEMIQRLPSRRPTCEVPLHVLRLIVNSLSLSRSIVRKQWIEAIWAIHAVSVTNGYNLHGAPFPIDPADDPHFVR